MTKPTDPKIIAYVEKAKKNVARNIRALIAFTDENYALRTATDANNRAHGYEAPYNDPAYVPYPDRNEDWKAVESYLQSRWEVRNDEVEETEWAVAVALHALPYAKQREVIALIDEALNPKDGA